MKNRGIALLVIAFLVVTGWMVFRGSNRWDINPPGQIAISQPVTGQSAAAAHPDNPTAAVGFNSGLARPNAASSLAVPVVATGQTVEATFESTNLPPPTILENMRTVIRQYGAMFGGNPVGTNPEITQALEGNNPKHINFLKADGNRVNGNGELVDAWGTPYFFHQLSGTEMEIRSAGPDRVMYTSDDLVIK